MFVAEHFLSGIVDKHGQYPVSIADDSTWYPQSCHFLKLKHHIHPFVYKDEKSIIERTMQYIKKIGLQNVLMITFHVEGRNVN
jgi:putative transposase